MRIAVLIVSTLLTVAANGCAVRMPDGVAYLAPTYAMPGPGYIWAQHPEFGWGWHHPYYGWHRGWA